MNRGTDGPSTIRDKDGVVFLPGASRRLPVLAMAAATLLSVAFVLPSFLIGVLAVELQRELALNAAQLGAAVSMFHLSRIVTSATAGRFVDHIPTSTTLRLAGVFSAVACVGAAVWSSRWITLVPWLALAGGAAVFGAAGVNRFLAEEIPRSKQGLSFGIRHAAPPSATLLGGIAVPTLALTLGWRWVFVAAGGLALLGILLVRKPSSGDASIPDRREGKVALGSSLAHLVLVSIGMFFGFGAAAAFTTFFVAGVVESGVTPSVGAILLGLGSVITIIVRLIVGAAADRHGGIGIRHAGYMIGIGAMGYALMSTSPLWMGLLGSALAFGMGWGFSGLLYFSVVSLNRGAPGTASGVVLMGGAGGGMMGPVFFGWLTDSISFQVAWRGLAGWGLLGAVCMVIADRRMERE